MARRARIARVFDICGLGALGGLWGNNRAASNDALTAMMTAELLRGRSCAPCDSDRDPVTQKELDMAQEIATLKTQNALRDANTYNDQKSLEMYKYVDGRMREIEAQLANQAVNNQATKDSFQLLQERLDCCCSKLQTAIETETKERCCADNSLVTYMNATFYPKMAANVTTGTTTTAQPLYNPLPVCGCDCKR